MTHLQLVTECPEEAVAICRDIFDPQAQQCQLPVQWITQCVIPTAAAAAGCTPLLLTRLWGGEAYVCWPGGVEGVDACELL
jgi:hypothetical protein